MLPLFGKRGLEHADLSTLEGNNAFYQGEEGIITADADVFAGLMRRAALPHDDGPGADLLAAKGLDAAMLRVTIPAVS